jgi:SAM-dependent methyltransferase
MSGYRAEVLAYFAGKAEHYDDVVHQDYWRLSDALLWSTLDQRVLARLAPEAHLLDAGGGTGRWTEKYLTARPRAGATVFDLSPDMLAQARAKAERPDLAGRMTTRQGDLTELATAYPRPAFDVVFCFHNVLGFVADPTSVVGQFHAVLRPGGVLAMVVPNQHHMAFFRIFCRDVAGAQEVYATRRGRFTPEMPDIAAFTPGGLTDLVAGAGFRPDLVTGFPSLIYPGYAETQLHGQTSALGDLLGDDDAFASVLALERALTSSGEAAARGNNLLIIATKQSGSGT